MGIPREASGLTLFCLPCSGTSATCCSPMLCLANVLANETSPGLDGHGPARAVS
ncbi:MAG: hypothetical protein ACN6QH_12755 [Pseudomonas sp.]|uniref:hypothetical protein n=1 Tax=Pseudomonas sp. TaxID=306 RepID=UPI003D0A7B00